MSTQLSKRALLSKGALSAGAGLGALGLFAQRTSADTPFTTFAFPATGAPTPRTMPDRLAETVNVKDFGAIGNGGTDDTATIQAAFNAAFGPPSNPHGAANCHLNRPVYFPRGEYKVNELYLTSVVGGRIYGDGFYASVLTGYGNSDLLSINGMSHSSFEQLGFFVGGNPAPNGYSAVDLNWDGVDTLVGLSDVTFFDCLVDQGNYGIRIARQNHGGRSISVIHVGFGSWVGCCIEGDECTVNSLTSTGVSRRYTFWVKKGTLTCNLQASAMPGGRSTVTGYYDIKHDSDRMTTVYGGRSESEAAFEVTNGTLVAIAFDSAQPVLNGPGAHVVRPGTLVMQECRMDSASNSAGGFLTGDGNVFLKGVYFQTNHPLYLSNFTGKVWQCETSSFFTYSQIAALAAAGQAGEGLLLNVSDSNTNTWGAAITGTGAYRVQTRWNGSAWTVVAI